MKSAEDEAEKSGLIIGGGIAGLAVALALLRQNIPVRVYEQAGAMGDVGAGISLGSTASKGLYALGLREALARVSDSLSASAALHYQTAEKLGGAFAARDFKPADFADTHMIHRADLFALLATAIADIDPAAVQFGRRFAGFTQDANGVTARFADGSSAHGAFLLGCDGIRSAVRAQMFGPGEAQPTGQAAYRFLVPMEYAQPYLTAGLSNIYVGPRRSLLYYPIRQGTLVNCVGLVCDDEWTGEGWSHQVPPAELQALFAGWHPNVIGLAGQAPAQKTAKWALLDRDPLPAWAQGRVALLGDAAHPMLPFLGMGAAMGIEDAVVLGRVFALEATVEAALRRYEAARLPRANAMLLDSRQQSRIFNDGPGSTRRTAMTVQERMMYDPATVMI